MPLGPATKPENGLEGKVSAGLSLNFPPAAARAAHPTGASLRQASPAPESHPGTEGGDQGAIGPSSTSTSPPHTHGGSLGLLPRDRRSSALTL